MKLSLQPVLNHSDLAKKLVPQMEFKGNFKSWKRKARIELSKLLGLHRMLSEKRPALNTRTLWKKSHELGSIEKIAFTSEPNVDVVGYLCLPKNIRPPYKTFICLQGHNSGANNSIAVSAKNDRTTIKVDGDRDFGLTCMRYGIAALCIEQRAFGEREDVSKNINNFYKKDLLRVIGRCHNPALHAMMLGRTLLGERVYDVDRSIDYLLSRNDMDPEHLGVMGNSGGGTASMFSGALLDRVTHVMPSCSFSTFKDSIMSIDHCICNYIPGLLTFGESADVLGLIAPKPLVLVSGIKDEIFPISPAKSEFKRLQKIYAAVGAKNLCRHVIGNGGHRFYADNAWPVMLKFF